MIAGFLGDFVYMFGHFDSKFIGIIGLRAAGNYSASSWSNIFGLLMREPPTLHFYDFGIFGRVQTPQNQYYFSLETPGHLNKIKNMPWAF